MAKTDKEESAKTPGQALAAPGPAQSEALTLGKVSLEQLDADSQTSATDLGIRAQDIAIPFIKVAQKMTPQISKRDPTYIDGLEEGDFFNSVTNEFYKGDPGILVIPCVFKPSYTEWRPRDSGGGLVKDWGTDESQMSVAVRNEKNKLVLPNGNHLVPSYMYFSLLIKNLAAGRYEPVVMNLYGTQLKKGRKWNAFMLNLRVPADQSPTGKEMKPRPWYQTYPFTTVPESNDQGEWMGLSFKYGPPTLSLPKGDDLYLAAAQFSELVGTGRATVKLDEFIEDVDREQRGEKASEESKKAF